MSGLLKAQTGRTIFHIRQGLFKEGGKDEASKYREKEQVSRAFQRQRKANRATESKKSSMKKWRELVLFLLKSGAP